MNARWVRAVFPPEEADDCLSALQDYVVVESAGDMREGMYVRWIPLDDPHLSRGGLFCGWRLSADGDPLCVCRTVQRPPRYYTLVFEGQIWFRRLTVDERVLLTAIDCLDQS